MMKKRPSYVLLFVMLWSVLSLSCRKIESPELPRIILEQTTYSVKQDRLLVITPEVESADDHTLYSWTMNNKVISTSPTLEFRQQELGQYHIKLVVSTESGTTSKDIQVNVVDLEKPMISFPEGDVFLLEVGQKHTFEPVITNTDNLKVTWMQGGKELSNDLHFEYTPTTEGSFYFLLRAENSDGVEEMLIKVTVVAEVPLVVSFPYPEQTVALGREVQIFPNIANSRGVTWEWYLDDVKQEDITTNFYPLKASSLGSHTLRAVATKGEKTGESTITINVVEPNKYYRPATDESSPYSTKVYEFMAAPGQFVNEGYTAFTMQMANSYAEGRLAQEAYVSLGGFGGYIVVGFDHSIKNNGEYDFAIMGNSFDGSSEPGIVWVMQDENGNGLPDDTWYELRGSETGKPETIQNYEVTYYRPTSPKSNVLWTDNQGNTGEIDWLGFHQQDYYYPIWVKENQYTLRGTRLEARTEDESGKGTYWVNRHFDWGYADNFSPIDRLTDDDNYYAAPNANHFKISHAMDYKGNAVHLEYIDFIKVQTGLNVKAGWLGENSTEVFKFIDIKVRGEEKKATSASTSNF